MVYTLTLDLMIKIISLMTSINNYQVTECLLLVSLTSTINLGIKENGCYAICWSYGEINFTFTRYGYQKENYCA